MFSEAKATPVDDSLPPAEALKAALECSVLDSKGKSHSLSSILASHQRTILVLVRHHHCGMCMEYVRSCSKNAKLQGTVEAAGDEGQGKRKGQGQVQVVVIGHGTWQGIDRYREMSGCAFEMYSDEGKQVYTALGMTRRFLGQTKDTKKASYLGEKDSTLSITASSLVEMVGSGSLIFKGGDIALLGGEFVLDQGPECVFAHRMRDTQDHTDVDKLAEFAERP